MSSKASKAAYKRCPETCQRVRAEIRDVIEKTLGDLGIELSSLTVYHLADATFDVSLQYGTEPVRDALIECEDELMETREVLDAAELDRDSYKHDARHWESLSEDLRGEVESLQSQLDSIPST